MICENIETKFVPENNTNTITIVKYQNATNKYTLSPSIFKCPAIA